MSYLSPFDPRLTEAQKDKVEKMAQDNLNAMFADQRKRTADLARTCESRADQLFPADKQMRDMAFQSFLIQVGLGTDDTSELIADQIEAGMLLPHRLVENYFRGNPAVRRFAAIAVAGSRFRKLNVLADQALAKYNGEFSSPSGQPTVAPMGLTDESEWSTGATPDSRCYAIAARAPGERKSIVSQIDFNDFLRTIENEPMCDLQMQGPSCDFNVSTAARKSSEGHIVNLGEYVPGPGSTPVPFVRGDVIIFVWICDSCWEQFCAKHIISGAEIIDPDDMID